MRKILIIVSFLLATVPAVACEPCKLVRVVDGDTVVVDCDTEQPIKLRLRYIDAPEMHQPYGPEAKQYLLTLLSGEPLSVCGDKLDLYGRELAEIFVPDLTGQQLIDINRKMVEDGYAWSYKHQNREFNDLEDEAHTAKRGLWIEDSPEAPWDYRRRKKNHQAFLDDLCDPIDTCSDLA